MKIRAKTVFLTAVWFQYSKIFINLLIDSNISCEGTHRPYLQLIPHSIRPIIILHKYSPWTQGSPWTALPGQLSSLDKAQVYFHRKIILPYEKNFYRETVSVKTTIILVKAQF